MPVGLIGEECQSIIAAWVLKTRKWYTPKGGRVQARRTGELTESPEARVEIRPAARQVTPDKADPAIRQGGDKRRFFMHCMRLISVIIQILLKKDK